MSSACCDANQIPDQARLFSGWPRRTAADEAFVTGTFGGITPRLVHRRAARCRRQARSPQGLRARSIDALKDEQGAPTHN